MVMQWKKGADFHLLVTELNRSRSQAHRRVSFKSFQFEDLAETVSGALQFPDDIPAPIRVGFVTSALFQITQSGRLAPDDVLTSVDNSVQQYLRTPVTPFWIRTTWSIDVLRPLFRSAQIHGATVSLRNIPQKFKQTSALNKAQHQLGLTVPSHYCPVLVKVSARDEHSAIDFALDSSDLLRGLVNYVINYKGVRRTYMGNRQPVNEVLPGPIHTVHNGNGSLLQDEMFWFDPRKSYVKQQRAHGRNYASIRKQTLLLKRRLERSSLRHIASSGLLRYVRALDHEDWTTCFFELWRALELVTCTNRPGASYEDTVRRASFVFENRALARQRLKHLRDRRN